MHLRGRRVKFFKSVRVSSTVIRIVKFVVLFRRVDLFFAEVDGMSDSIQEGVEVKIIDLT